MIPEVGFLEGERTVLRAFDEGDVEVWHSWFNDPLVTDGMNKGLYPNTREAQRHFLASMYSTKADLQLAIVHRATRRLIGTVGLHGIDFFNSTADISIVIGARDFWGQGFGKEAVAIMVQHAFQKLCLHKTTAGMFETNHGSRYLFESLGFRPEAVLREQAAWHGRRVDILRYGLLSREWNQSKSKEIGSC